ncbi:MAG: hypothetical protein ABIT10_02645 [Alteraurantiacibacter sp.]
MDRRSLLVSTAVALAVLTLPGCAEADDGPPDYRYRLTVEVDTPEGVRTGSSVIAVEQRLVGPGSNPAGTGVERHIQGEAVAVDLPGGRTLFALLRSEEDVDWASRVFVLLAPRISGETFAEELDNVLLVQGENVLPRTWPPVGHLPERPAYPMLVTFADLSDPTSVARVDPDDLAASFGEGVTLRRITMQLTSDPVTTGIEQRLVWLANQRGSLIPIPRGTPIGDMPIGSDITEGDFSRSTAQ